MRRYMSRHWSVRNHRSYLPLNSSDTQLDRAAAVSECPESARCSADDGAKTEQEEVATQRDRNTRKRRLFHHLRRRRKRHGDGDAVVGQERAASPCDEFEVAVEATLNNCDVIEPGASHVVEHGSLLTLACATRNNVELDIQALDLATTINKSGFYHHHHHHRHGEQQQLASRATRRFAICEELEREMIMEDGVNLRKSRKNLVIRQVLHDLLLL